MSAVITASATRPAPSWARPRASDRLRLLTAGELPSPGMARMLEQIAALPWVESVLALPDLHHKAHMEVPSSLAITSAGAIVPEFTSVAINDGMGLILTDLDAREMTRERILRFFARLGANAAAHPLDANRYSLAREDLPWVLLEGGRVAAERYGLDPAVPARMEWGARIPIPGGAGGWRDAVPCALMRTRLGCSEMGLNFGGNHFLELQTVDQVLDPATAASWGLAPHRVAIMYHLGPGPFSGTLLHFFSRREKLSQARAPLFFLAKLAFHFVRRRGYGSARRKWALHFRRNRWTPFAPDSEEGETLRQALAVAMNFGFAYRLATVAAVRDALAESISHRIRTELLCDVSHNSLVEEPRDGGSVWVARHNACRLAPGGPAIVAGANDVPSYLARGADDAPAELHSYDHGAGHLIEAWRREGQLTAVGETARRVQMTRGRSARIVSEYEVPLCSSEPIDRLMESLERHRMLRPVVRMRPIATLGN